MLGLRAIVKTPGNAVACRRLLTRTVGRHGGCATIRGGHVVSCGSVVTSVAAAPLSARTVSSGPQRPNRSQHLQRRSEPAQSSTADDKPVRYGPQDVDLQPRDQLRPLLPTWNPPPTRRPKPEELGVSTRVRLLFEDRWWAATVREVSEDPNGTVKVAYDGWPSRHDEFLPRDSDRLYLHESSHPDFKDPPAPKRFERPVPLDEDGNPVVAAPRAPRVKVFDPEKERLKRALRPPLPYNPEKERLKRMLRGQHVNPVDEEPPFRQDDTSRDDQPLAQSEQLQQQQQQQQQQQHQPQQEQPQHQPQQQQVQQQPKEQAAFNMGSASPSMAVTAPPGVSTSASPSAFASATASASASPAPAVAPSPPVQPVDLVQWVEVAPPPGEPALRTFRNTSTGELLQGAPTSGWVEIAAEGGARYYWNVEGGVTQWTRPQ
eukprot:TRINITY_DN8264_c0_g3_i1.p1 TRINITY_DN8264_c0_g3~~TRINITY_DN8264_c0_g3_i1.p1  ORF type:complete len:450 (-),score=96.06 TRINITY_DN8264_c0_g3_i1:47-1342(-)